MAVELSFVFAKLNKENSIKILLLLASIVFTFSTAFNVRAEVAERQDSLAYIKNSELPHRFSLDKVESCEEDEPIIGCMYVRQAESKGIFFSRSMVGHLRRWDLKPANIEYGNDGWLADFFEKAIQSVEPVDLKVEVNGAGKDLILDYKYNHSRREFFIFEEKMFVRGIGWLGSDGQLFTFEIMGLDPEELALFENKIQDVRQDIKSGVDIITSTKLGTENLRSAQ